ncbi:MAG: hypothetical protein COV72_03810, partial [Candidatus Omnitrophica bacterium CG11_big_fil_rev_8_21_14_0_20_42_13]
SKNQALGWNLYTTPSHFAEKIEKKSRFKTKNFYFHVILSWFLIPFSIIFFRIKYDGMRHIFVMYPALSIACAAALFYFLYRLKIKPNLF